MERRGPLAPAFLLSYGTADYVAGTMGYEKIPARLAAIREQIEAACARAGRDPAEVTIVAVTKTHPSAAVEAVRAAGLPDVGENRVQELEEKVAALGRHAVRWHLIGHVQRNKARRAVELADLIHSVDSERLARRLSDEAIAQGKRIEVLAQVNVSGEETKGGLEGPRMLEQLAELCKLPGLRVMGLMTMAPLAADEGTIREVFATTRRLAEDARSIAGFEARHLSMGMSGDFEIAVEEGSTLVRIGSALLGERGP